MSARLECRKWKRQNDKPEAYFVRESKGEKSTKKKGIGSGVWSKLRNQGDAVGKRPRKWEFTACSSWKRISGGVGT